MTFSDRMRGLLAGVLALTLGGLRAQALDYPTRPVTIVVPFAAGGGTDILGRLVAQRLEHPMDNPAVEGLQDFVKSEIVRWGAVVRRAGLAGSE
jgi:hypothetical protein